MENSSKYFGKPSSQGLKLFSSRSGLIVLTLKLEFFFLDAAYQDFKRGVHAFVNDLIKILIQQTIGRKRQFYPMCLRAL